MRGVKFHASYIGALWPDSHRLALMALFDVKEYLGLGHLSNSEYVELVACEGPKFLERFMPQRGTQNVPKET